MNSVALISIFLFVVAGSYAIPVPNAKEDPRAAVDKYLREALENFRAQMKEGIPAINMPIVEPLHLKDQKVQVDQDHVELDLKLHEIKVVGLSLFEIQGKMELLESLSYFEQVNSGTVHFDPAKSWQDALRVPRTKKMFYHNLFTKTDNTSPEGDFLPLTTFHELETDMPNLRVKAIFRFPLVTINGIYDVKGKVMKFIPIYGDGKYNITIEGAEVGGETSLLLGEETMEITPPKLHIKWTNIQMDLGNFLGGGSFGENIQKVLSSLGTTLFEKYREQILERAGNAIAKQANQALSTDKVKEMVGKIIQGFMGV